MSDGMTELSGLRMYNSLAGRFRRPTDPTAKTSPFGEAFVVFETGKSGSGDAGRLRHAMIPGPQRSAPADAANSHVGATI